jgi:hypothetical protein
MPYNGDSELETQSVLRVNLLKLTFGVKRRTECVLEM